MKLLPVLAVLAVFATSCTSITVAQVAGDSKVTEVCIIENPQVMVSDFIAVLRDGLNRHGISSKVVSEAAAASCETTLTYTALRSWDFAPYLSHAELRLWRSGRQIGSADYHLKGKGGLSMAKWQGTRAKIDPVIDQLFAQN